MTKVDQRTGYFTHSFLAGFTVAACSYRPDTHDTNSWAPLQHTLRHQYLLPYLDGVLTPFLSIVFSVLAVSPPSVVTFPLGSAV